MIAKGTFLHKGNGKIEQYSLEQAQETATLELYVFVDLESERLKWDGRVGICPANHSTATLMLFLAHV